MHAYTHVPLLVFATISSSALALDASPPPPIREKPNTLGELTLVESKTTDSASEICTTALGEKVCRTLSARSADHINVKDYGARLNGSDDTVAFRSARVAAGRHGIVDVPQGEIMLSATPLSGSSLPILWRLSGNSYARSTAPVYKIGTDVVETFIGEQGGKFFSKGSTNPDEQGVVRIDQSVTHIGGTPGNTIPTLSTNTEVLNSTENLNNYIWGVRHQMTIKAIGPGQHVGVSSTIRRPADSLADGRGPRAAMWPFYLEARDMTEQPANLSGAMVTAEWDMMGNGGDPSGQRIMHHMILQKHNPKGAPMRVSQGSVIGTNDIGPPNSQSYVGVGYQVQTPFDVAAFDTTLATSLNGAPAFRMSEGQRFAFNGNKSSYSNFISYKSGILTYQTIHGPAFRSTDKGDFTVPGVINTQGLNLPDAIAPSGTSDPSGQIGDVRFSGQYIYRKTNGGWYRFTGSPF